MKNTNNLLPADFWTRSHITHPRTDVGRYQQIGLKPELGFGIGVYSLLSTLVPGTSVQQLMIGNLDSDQVVLQLRPRAGGTESTLSFYLSEEGNYDCYADVSLNRLSDPDVPKFVTYLRGDGFPVPEWSVAFRQDAGAYTKALGYDPVTQLFDINEKVAITPEGGIAVLVENRTGTTSVKGTLVKTSASFANAVELTAVNVPDTVGVVYQAGIANGRDMWVVISGIADVLFVNNTTAGQFARSCKTGDTGAAAGKAYSEALPSPPSSDTYFYEIGHVFESKTAGQLVKVNLHFN